MTNQVVRRPSGFDYGFRPNSYFEDLDPSTLVVASILGEERRKDVQDRLASEDFDPLVWGEWLTESTLDDSTRRLIGRVHPRFMGGEYLPSFGGDEIEIARIVMASVTQDVISIRARRQGKRIFYRVADEYESTFMLSKTWSIKPLTLRELISLIDGSNQADDTKATGLVFSILDWNIETTGEPEEMRRFIAVSSGLYRELGPYYDQSINRRLDKFSVREDAEEEVA